MLRSLAFPALLAVALSSAATQTASQATPDAARPQDKPSAPSGTKPSDKPGDKASDKDKPPAKPAPPVVTENVIPMQDAPTAYRAVYTDARFGPPLQLVIERNGSRVLVDRGPAVGAHTRTLYDLTRETRVSFAWPSPAGTCVRAALGSDWGDPFAASVFNGTDTHFGGMGKAHGLNANIMEGPSASGGSARAWFDTATSLLLKVEETAPGGSVANVLDLISFDRTAPPDSTFAVPPACAAPAAPDELRAQLLGKHAAEFVPANIPPPEPDTGSCTVLFRVVLGEKLTPLSRGFQTAVDLAVDPAHLPAYGIEVTPEGHATFAGGQLYEMTGQFRDGVLRIEHAPAAFEIDTEFGTGGSAHALIRRQCSAPETPLLLIVRDPAHPADASAWVWMHPQKPASRP